MEVLCQCIKNTPTIVSLNLTGAGLTCKSADMIAKLVKVSTYSKINQEPSSFGAKRWQMLRTLLIAWPDIPSSPLCIGMFWVVCPLDYLSLLPQ